MHIWDYLFYQTDYFALNNNWIKLEKFKFKYK